MILSCCLTHKYVEGNTLGETAKGELSLLPHVCMWYKSVQLEFASWIITIVIFNQPQLKQSNTGPITYQFVLFKTFRRML